MFCGCVSFSTTVIIVVFLCYYDGSVGNSSLDLAVVTGVSVTHRTPCWKRGKETVHTESEDALPLAIVLPQLCGEPEDKNNDSGWAWLLMEGAAPSRVTFTDDCRQLLLLGKQQRTELHAFVSQDTVN
jgi:hypothetical protein